MPLSLDASDLKRAGVRFCALTLALWLLRLPGLEALSSSLPATTTAYPVGTLALWIFVGSVCQALVVIPATFLEAYSRRGHPLLIVLQPVVIWSGLALAEVEFAYVWTQLCSGLVSFGAPPWEVALGALSALRFRPEFQLAGVVVLLVSFARERRVGLAWQLLATHLVALLFLAPTIAASLAKAVGLALPFALGVPLSWALGSKLSPEPKSAEDEESADLEQV